MRSRYDSMLSVFEAKDYRSFIRDQIASSRFERGVQTRLAEYLNVHGSFISSVLAGKQDFTPEQGLKICEFLELDPEATETLILMVHRERAGTLKLKRHYQNQLDRGQAARNEIKTRLKPNQKLNPDNLISYFSSWFNIAVHMCLRNPERRNADAVAKALKLGHQDVVRSIELLEQLGLIKRERSKLIPLEPRYHLDKKSPALRAHHTNCRQTAIRSLDESNPDDLHYSLVMSIDQAAFDQIKSVLLESIGRIDPLVMKAEDREVYTFCLDLFKVT